MVPSGTLYYKIHKHKAGKDIVAYSILGSDSPTFTAKTAPYTGSIGIEYSKYTRKHQQSILHHAALRMARAYHYAKVAPANTATAKKGKDTAYSDVTY
jgi:hypothetical protein